MPKGGMSRLRSGGNGRTGLRDCPPELREILQAYIESPQLLAGLPPAARAEREQQIAALQATRAMRSEASRRGHEVRRARETARLIDLLVDAGDDAERVWDGLTPRQQQLVDEEIAAEIAREKGAK